MLSAQHPVRVRQPDIAGVFFSQLAPPVRADLTRPVGGGGNRGGALPVPVAQGRLGQERAARASHPVWTRPDFNLTSGVVPLKTDAVSPLPCLDRCPELHRRLEDTHALERNVYPVLDI